MSTYITQGGLADRAGLHRTAISLLERGGRVPRVDTVLRIATALSVEPARFLNGIQVQLPERPYANVEWLSPKERDQNIEVGLLTIVFGLHPEHLRAEELIHRALAAAPRPTEEQTIEQGLERLKEAELLREIDGRIAPTRAALHFGQLPY
jgi:transcriptional regulator with XRE-family HTH domain